MRFFLHDYAGHPFQVDLSRALCRRGHTVTHAYFAGDKGPKGNFVSTPDDQGRLEFLGVSIRGGYDKSSLCSRRFKDVECGRNVAAEILKRRPEIVLSGNTPTETQTEILKASRKVGAAFIYWVQDFYSIATTKVLQRKFGAVGGFLGGYYRFLERRQFQQSDAIVLITDDFQPRTSRWAGDDSKIFVIENWGALDHIRPGSKDNAWARQYGLNDKFVFLYSGTLALKHSPELLVALARKWKERSDVAIVVVAQGVGVEYLRAAKAKEGLDGLVLLPLQPFEDLENVLATSDVLVAVLEPEAGTFSVPSKVQSYLCAHRPILLAASPLNLAARLLVKHDAGLTVSSGDCEAFLEAAGRLFTDEALRKQLSDNGRGYAERTFDVDAITDNFERVFAKALQHKAQGSTAAASAMAGSDSLRTS